jgi:Asp-tRNA(Asn)/Glu-tRNA(Gln) amidotransferase A subunit family amidase
MAADVPACSGMLEVLAPGFTPTEVELDDLEVGVACLELADPLVRARVEAAAEHFPRRRRVEIPDHESFGVGDVFRREAADVHRELFEEHAESYGDNVRAKLERCLAVTDVQYERALIARRRFCEQLDDATADVDLLLTPTLVCVAPRTGQDELSIRDTLTRLTYPFNTAGWPALALPCGKAEDGLPASVQLAAPPGEDARVLAAGAALEQALSLV